MRVFIMERILVMTFISWRNCLRCTRGVIRIQVPVPDRNGQRRSVNSCTTSLVIRTLLWGLEWLPRCLTHDWSSEWQVDGFEEIVGGN